MPMIPATAALLSLLALKLLDKERRSHISDFNFDEALGLFAGLNVPPKKSYATAYSYRTTRAHREQLLSGWVAGCRRSRVEGDNRKRSPPPIPEWITGRITVRIEERLQPPLRRGRR